MSVTVRRLTEALCPAFWRVHSDEHDAGWCRCVAWWVDTWEGWGERTAEENRRLREGLVARGEHDGYLLFEDEEPRAWCQVGPRDRLAKLARQFELAPDPHAWAVTCFVVVPEARRRGLARTLLRGVLDDLARRAPAEGIRTVEAFPRSSGAGDADPLELWNGPEALYREAGFEPRRRVGARHVMVRTV